jgi:hypothetical protein
LFGIPGGDCKLVVRFKLDVFIPRYAISPLFGALVVRFKLDVFIPEYAISPLFRPIPSPCADPE